MISDTNFYYSFFKKKIKLRSSDVNEKADDMSLTSQVKHSHQHKKYPFNQVYICCELNNAQFNNILKRELSTLFWPCI